MTVSRINWPEILTGPVDVVPVVLVAGVPVVLVPAGVHPTATAVTSGTVDPAWWPGVGTLVQTLHDGPVTAVTFDPVRGWLSPDHEWQFYEEARPAEGDVTVEALTFEVYDPPAADGALSEATRYLSGPNARVTQLLSQSITATSTDVLVDSLTDVPTYGIGHIGREAFTYSSRRHSPEGVVIDTGAGDMRGAFGSRAVDHAAPAEHRPAVTFGALPRWWQGRRAAVFFARIAGATLYDPSLMFLGTVGAGVNVTRGGTTWSVPLDAVTVALNRKVVTATVAVQGFNHRAYFAGVTPLAVGGVTLGADSHDGWHPDAPGYVRDLNAALVASTSPARVYLAGGRVTVTPGAAPCDVLAAWNNPTAQTLGASTDPTTLQTPMPRACVVLDGVVHLDPLDVAKIPTTLTVTATVGTATGTARYTLVADTDNTKGLVSVIVGRDEAAGTVTLSAVVDDVPGVSGYDALLARARAALVTRPTTAQLSIEATGDTSLAALRALVAAGDLLGGGGDLLDESVAWDEIAAEFARAPLPYGLDVRRYRPNPDATPLTLLVHEFRLRGCMMVMRRGRVSCARIAQFASTERVTGDVLEGDVVTDSSQRPVPLEMVYGVRSSVTTVKFSLPGGATFAWTDTTFRDEFGDGADVECKALLHMPETATPNGIVTGLQTVAQQILGPLAEPMVIVRLTTGPHLLDVMAGDVVRLTHSIVPTLEGTRGVDGLVCQVVDVRRALWGDVARVTLGLRLGRPDLRGYAPSFIVAAGGITGADVTADTSSAWGVTCFADVRASAVDGFAVGYVVELCEIDSETPTTSSTHTVTAVDTATGVVTLDPAPDAAWSTLAAAQYKVCVRFAAYTAATSTQHTVAAYVADPTTATLGGGDAPHRWAA